MLKIGVQTRNIVNDECPERGFALLKQTGFSCADFSLNEYLRNKDIYQSNRVLTEDKISQPFDLEVSVAELLGHEYFCHSDFGGTEIVSKIHAKTIVNAGDKLNLVFDLSKIHLFDPTTQKIIK